MSVKAAGFTAHCDTPGCEALVRLPHTEEAEARKTLVERFRWRRVDLDGVVVDLCPGHVAAEIQKRGAPLVYVGQADS